MPSRCGTSDLVPRLTLASINYLPKKDRASHAQDQSGLIATVAITMKLPIGRAEAIVNCVFDSTPP